MGGTVFTINWQFVRNRTQLLHAQRNLHACKKIYFFYFHFLPLPLQCLKSTKIKSYNNKITIIE